MMSEKVKEIIEDDLLKSAEGFERTFNGREDGNSLYRRAYLYIQELKAENAKLHELRSRAELRAESAESELSHHAELIAKDELCKAAVKDVLGEIYREVERVRLDCEYQLKYGAWVMDEGEFLNEFTLGVLPRLYNKYGLDMFAQKEEKEDEAD